MFNSLISAQEMWQLLSELKGDIVGVKNMWQIVLVGVMIDSNLYITVSTSENYMIYLSMLLCKKNFVFQSLDIIVLLLLQ